MGEIMGMETGIDLPSLAASSVGFYILMGLVIIVMLGITALVLWWYFQRRLYRFKIIVFENISGQGWQVAMRDSAKYLRLSVDGTEVLWLRKKKIPLTAYGKKMGTNQYWFAIGQDGGWYNFVLGDLDAKMGTLDIEPIDRDIKYVSVAMRRNAAENYGPKITWMDKYGSWLMGGVVMIIFLVGLYFIVEQIGNLVQELTKAAATNNAATETVTRALAHVDAILSGGSGITAA